MAVKLLSAAAAPICTPTVANMRELQVGGANRVAALGGAAVDLASGAWFEAATIRMGVDSEHSSAVLAVPELLLGPDGLPGRFHVANRNDARTVCAGMLAEVLRTADAVANLNNTLHMRPAAVQAARIMVALRSSMAPPPMFVVPEPTQPGGYEYLAMLRAQSCSQHGSMWGGVPIVLLAQHFQVQMMCRQAPT